jgi:hypothetical protein
MFTPLPLLFNCSWDRDPSLILDPVTGKITTTKADDVLKNNFIIANYNSLGAVDNDDGSSYYRTESNFFVYGGGSGFCAVCGLEPFLNRVHSRRGS